MTLKVCDQKFTYLQAREFLTDYLYWNPQEISCFEEKYIEVAKFEQRLPKNPSDCFYSPDYFFAFSSLFGEEFFTSDEIVEFCSFEYQKIPDDSKPATLLDFYKKLRVIESRMPSGPDQTYGLSSIRVLFGLEKIVFFTYQDARAYCIREYEKLPKNKKPKQLTRFYKKLSSREARLRSSPNRDYMDKGWVSFRVTFGLEDIVHLSYEEAVAYCSEEYKKLPNKERPTDLKFFYSDLRDKNVNLLSTPSKCYKNMGWVSWGVLFGLDKKVLFSYEDAVEYCSGKYRELPDDKKPTNLTTFCLELRAIELRLPRVPGQVYKNKGWISYKELFHANEKNCFTYDEAVEYCAQKYCECPLNEKPTNLRKFYKLLKASEPRLIGSPEEKYKGKGWQSIMAMFCLV
jgi:hypothetical protein